MPSMKAVQVSKPGGDFEVVERPIPEPGREQVRIKVEACGVCHSDVLVKEGFPWPGLKYPRVPGHEISGKIDAIGPDVTLWKPGQRVGVGWHGGHCFECEPCRRGDFINCKFEKITGLNYDGRLCRVCHRARRAVAAMPENLPADKPRRSCARDHRVQCDAPRGGESRGHGCRAGHRRARASGNSVCAANGFPHGGHRARSRQRGAREKTGRPRIRRYGNVEAAPALQKLGGANLILATAPDSKAMLPFINGLGPNGTLLVVGAGPDPIAVTPAQLIFGNRNVKGWASARRAIRRNAEFQPAQRCASDDRALSAGKGYRSVRAE